MNIQIRSTKSLPAAGRRISKQYRMTEIKNSKIYDLENRTQAFAKNVRNFVKKLPKTIANIEDGKQLIKASGSVGANYIEANETLGKKDFMMRIRICRKEAKESRYGLRLIDTCSEAELESERHSFRKGSNRAYENIWFNFTED